MVLEYTLYGEPVPMPRAAGGKFGRFHPPRVKTEMGRHREAVELAIPEGWPTAARYVVTVTAYRSTARKCDGDNLLKLVLDSINRIAFDDDSQVDVMHIEKRMDREEPRTEVRVEVMRDEH